MISYASSNCIGGGSLAIVIVSLALAIAQGMRERSWMVDAISNFSRRTRRRRRENIPFERASNIPWLSPDLRIEDLAESLLYPLLSLPLYTHQVETQRRICVKPIFCTPISPYLLFSTFICPVHRHSKFFQFTPDIVVFRHSGTSCGYLDCCLSPLAPTMRKGSCLICLFRDMIQLYCSYIIASSCMEWYKGGISIVWAVQNSWKAREARTSYLSS